MYLANACWLLIAVIPTLSILWMVLDFMSHEYHYKTYGFKFWHTTPDKSLSIIIFVLVIIFGIHSIINSSYALISEYNDTFHPSWCASSYIQLGWFAFSKMFLYAFYIVRLHMVFQNSSFAVSVVKLKLLTLFVSVPIFVNACLGWYSTAYIMKHINDSTAEQLALKSFKDCSILGSTYTPHAVTTALLCATATLMLTELIYWMVILRLFVSRVLLLSLSFNTMKSRMRVQSASQITRDKSHTNTDVEEAVDEIQKKRKQKKLTHTEKMELKNNELFINLALKTTNLIILSLCTNYVIAIKFGLDTPGSLLMIDAVSNGFSVYCSYAFSSKHYDRFFGVCHTHCYGCCVRLCYCCCLQTKLVTPMLSSMDVHNEYGDESKTSKCISSDTEERVIEKVASDTDIVFENEI